eukprot:752336_1
MANEFAILCILWTVQLAAAAEMKPKSSGQIYDLIFPDESTALSYHGQLLNGKQDGQGTMKMKNGDVLKGQWKAGKQEGKGAYILQDGSQFEGLLKDGLPNGYG